MDSTPATLLDQVRRPDDARAWERFVRLYTPLLLGFARRLGLQDADAADLVQDVFADLVRAMPGFRYDPARSFRAWLGAVAWNRWRDRARKRRPVPADPADPVWDRLPAADPAASFEEGEYRAALTERALAVVRPEFSPAVWGLFEATVLGTATPAAAAAAAGVSVNAVYLARSRVLRRLREVLTGLLD